MLFGCQILVRTLHVMCVMFYTCILGELQGHCIVITVRSALQSNPLHHVSYVISMSMCLQTWDVHYLTFVKVVFQAPPTKVHLSRIQSEGLLARELGEDKVTELPLQLYSICACTMYSVCLMSMRYESWTRANIKQESDPDRTITRNHDIVHCTCTHVYDGEPLASHC